MNCNIKKIYVAGSMAGRDAAEVIKEREIICGTLRDNGIIPIDPSRGRDILGVMDDFDMHVIVARDLADIRESDAVLITTGHEVSWGTALEFGYAVFKLEKPVFIIDKNYIPGTRRLGWNQFLATQIFKDIDLCIDHINRYWRGYFRRVKVR